MPIKTCEDSSSEEILAFCSKRRAKTQEIRRYSRYAIFAFLRMGHSGSQNHHAANQPGLKLLYVLWVGLVKTKSRQEVILAGYFLDAEQPPGHKMLLSPLPKKK